MENSVQNTKLPLSDSSLESDRDKRLPNKSVSRSSSTPSNLTSVPIKKKRNSLWQNFRDSSIQTKLSVAFGATGVLYLLGLGITVAIIDRSLRIQLFSQAQAELSLLAINYNTALRQEGSGSRGQAEDNALIFAAQNDKSSPIVKSIIESEVSARRIDFITLVNKSKLIVVNSGTNNLIGKEYNPSGLVEKAIAFNEEVISNEVLPYTEVAAMVPGRVAQLGDANSTPNFLVRYTVKPIRDLNRNLVGAIVFSEILNGKNVIVDRTNKSIGGGFSAIAVGDSLVSGGILVGDRNLRSKSLPSDLLRRTNQSPSSLTLEQWRFLGAASYSPIASGTVQTNEATIEGRRYSFAAAPILSESGKAVGVLLRGTGHEALDNLRWLTFMLVGGIGMASIAFGLVISRAAGNLIVKPIKLLEQVTKQYTQGNYSKRAEVGSQDEVGLLSDVFNKMADNIQRREAEQMASKAELKAQSLYLQDEVGHLLEIVSDLESGDLTVQAKVSDMATGLLADTINRLIEQLVDVMAAVFGTAQQVTLGAEQLEELAIAVSQNAQEQDELATKARVGMDSVNRLAKDSSQQAISADASVQSAQEAVVQGRREINSLTGSISLLQQATVQMVQRIKTLGEFVALAKQFVQDQKRLASLTQVLAMNASMVAARAIEQKEPDQFATVAREFEAIAAQVNNLATQTNQGLVTLQQRTGFIEIVVTGIDQDVRDVNSLVAEFTSGVEQSNQSFTNIQTVTEQVAKVGQSVTQSAGEIATAILSSFDSIQDIAAVAERSASQARITRERSSEMGELARRLLEDIQFFRLPASKIKTIDTNSQPVPELISGTDIESDSNGYKHDAAEVLSQ